MRKEVLRGYNNYERIIMEKVKKARKNNEYLANMVLVDKHIELQFDENISKSNKTTNMVIQGKKNKRDKKTKKLKYSSYEDFIKQQLDKRQHEEEDKFVTWKVVTYIDLPESWLVLFVRERKGYNSNIDED